MRKRDIDDLHRSEVPSDPTRLNGKPKWAFMLPSISFGAVKKFFSRRKRR